MALIFLVICKVNIYNLYIASGHIMYSTLFNKRNGTNSVLVIINFLWSFTLSHIVLQIRFNMLII